VTETDFYPIRHRRPADMGDRLALGFTKTMRFFADLLFGDRHEHRVIVIETVAAVPGMVGAALTHLKCLRTMTDDRGWIRTLMEEAENERMHLMTFVEVARPNLFERLLIMVVQAGFYCAFFALYLIAPRVAHRVVGYFEEEAIISYNHFLAAIDAGRIANGPAPAIACHYWKLPDNARLRDVVMVVRADEAHHSDVNHRLADELAGRAPSGDIAPYPEHAAELSAGPPATAGE
jgi:ubiquinol oxidase